MKNLATTTLRCGDGDAIGTVASPAAERRVAPDGRFAAQYGLGTIATAAL